MIFRAILAALPAVGTALHSRASASAGRRLGLLAGRAEPETQSPECSQLTNVLGTHMTMPVLIGTPPQKFDLIPDTGSPWVIVAAADCFACDCGRPNKCMNRNKSKTMQIPNLVGTGSPETHVLGFGSGPIRILVSTDEVRIDGTKIHHNMDRGVLLMEDNGLSFDGPFEGLLGLGIPEYKSSRTVSRYHEHNYTDGFLHRAGIQSFSLCLSKEGMNTDGGVLRYNAPEGKELLGITDKTMHWQLAFHGVTVGAGQVSPFCQHPEYSDSASPCAAIVDSGTTFVLGPYNHIEQLFSDLCDGWERCRTEYEQARAAFTLPESQLWEGGRNRSQTPPKLLSKAELFELLLNNCQTWMDKKSGIEELPKVSLIMKGRSGNEFRLELEPWDYIISELETKIQINYAKKPGVSYITGWERTTKQTWTCGPAFAYMEMLTERNGPAWILGLPIFYSHRVSYNIDHNPPTISFTQESCGGCYKDHREIHRSNHTGSQETPKLPRKLHGAPLLPKEAHKMRL